MIFALFAFGILLLYGRRTAAWGRRWLTAVIAGYWFLSTPFGSWAVSSPIGAKYGQVRTRAAAQGAEAVVMLGGGIINYSADHLDVDDVGTSAYRAIETARLYALLGDPLVIVSGGNT